MSNLAELGIRFSTQGADAAEKHLDAVSEKSERAERATDRLSGSFGRTSTASGEMQAELARNIRTHQDLLRHTEQLGGSFGRMAGDVAAGRASMEGMTREGGNVARTLFSMGGRVAVVGGLVAGLTGTLVIGAMAWRDYDSRVRSAENALLGVGRATGMTASDLQKLAADAGRASGISQRAAEDLSKAYIRAGITNRDVLRDLTALTKGYAVATEQDLGQAQTDLARRLDASRSGLEAVESKLGVFDDKTRQHLITLIDQKKHTEYVQAVVKALGEEFVSAADNVNIFEKALKGAGNAWDDFWGGFGKFGGAFFNMDRSTEGQLSRRVYSGNMYDPVRERLSGQLATEQGIAKAKADQEAYNVTMRDGRAAAESLMPYERERARVLGDIAQVQKALALPGMSGDTQLNAALRAAQVRLARINETAGRDGARKPPSNRSAINREQSLARELEAMRLTAQANRDLATAYGESEAAGLRAAARAEIVGRAVKRQGDIEAFVAAQLEVNASKAAVDAAKAIADLRVSTEARERMNAAVASGLMTADQANEQLQLEAELRPIIAAAAVAEGQDKRDLEADIRALTDARRADNAAAREAQIIEANRKDRNQLGELGAELGLVGASDMERAVAMARLQRSQELGGDAGSAAGKAAIQLAEEMAAAQVRLEQKQRAYNLGLEFQLDLLRQIDDTARSAADGMASAFGTAGRAMGDITTALTGYQVRIEGINRAEDEYRKSVGECIDPRRIEMFAKDREQAEVQSYGNMISAAKSYFEEGSAGYKAMHAAEMAYRAYQFASAIQAMVLGGQETAFTLGQNAIRATSHGVVAVARAIASLPFPLNLAAGAATIAALGAIGVRIAGGGGRGRVGANDNEGPDHSVNAVRSYMAQDAAARDQAAHSLAQAVTVRVEFNDPMFKARVQKEAVGATAPMIVAAAAGTKRDVFQTLNDRQVGNRKVSV